MAGADEFGFFKSADAGLSDVAGAGFLADVFATATADAAGSSDGVFARCLSLRVRRPLVGVELGAGVLRATGDERQQESGKDAITERRPRKCISSSGLRDSAAQKKEAPRTL